MAVIVLCSAKGSPGVSLAATALTLTWPGRVLLAEADPAGGDALGGFLAGQVTADRGTAGLAVAHARGRLFEELFANLIDLTAPRQDRLLLPGVPSPASAPVVADIAADLAATFAGLGHTAEPLDVIVDAGRLCAPHVLWPVIAQADVVLLVVRATLPSLAHAHHGLAQLDAARPQHPASLLVMDDGPYTTEVSRRVNAPVAAVWPWAPRTARRLSRGGTVPGRGHRLMIEAQRLARSLHRDTAALQLGTADVR